eukprot:5794937-Prymnesium_polylepis.1
MATAPESANPTTSRSGSSDCPARRPPAGRSDSPGRRVATSRRGRPPSGPAKRPLGLGQAGKPPGSQG